LRCFIGILSVWLRAAATRGTGQNGKRREEDALRWQAAPTENCNFGQRPSAQSSIRGGNCEQTGKWRANRCRVVDRRDMMSAGMLGSDVAV